MSTWNIRPIAIPDDFARIAAIVSAVSPEPFTAAQLAEQEQKPNGYWHRIVATDAAGCVVGYGHIRRYPFEKPGRFNLRASVDPAYRGQGAGRALVAALEEWLAPHNPTEYETWVREDSPESAAFAQRRGFAVVQHVFESTLDPHTFDERPFAGVVEGAAAAGIRFFTLAEETSEEAVRKLYDLYARCAPDIPGYSLASYPEYGNWREWVMEGESTCREGMVLAADGERVVACSVLCWMKGSGALYIDFTCVDREYRGRHLALALKLLSIRVARQLGAPYIRTNNDSNNAPMLAINRQLGYVPAPGSYTMRRPVR